jgi:predicted nucleic acid-binding protein
VIVCLDTAVLIWGVRGFASRNQEHESVRAERYIKWLTLKQAKVLVPSIVLSEYLVGANATELHDGTIFEKGFQIAPFDVPAAKIAADLSRDIDLIKTVAREHQVQRQCIKSDIMIAAVAIHRQAEKIITTDSGFRVFERIVADKIAISKIPEIPENFDDEQQELF